jgi:16S rRNA (cytidine1402-2'-O)-methyltransferase
MSRRPTGKRSNEHEPRSGANHFSPHGLTPAVQTRPADKPSKRSEGGEIPGLIVVATPIGNAADITLRALEALRTADAIACEDTRVTGKLLAIHGLSAKLIAYHDHNAERVRPLLIERLERGETVALVSDAGTPLVSDPGYRLVRECIARGIKVTPLPGASSLLAALTVAGLPTDRFLFAGFLPAKSAARRAALAELAAVPATLVFYESPHRLAAALADMTEILGARDAAVARELTKLYEEVRRGPLADLADFYAGAPAPKGEIVVVVGPPHAAPPPHDDSIDAALRATLAEMSLRDAVAKVTRDTGMSRARVYARALALRGAAEGDEE